MKKKITKPDGTIVEIEGEAEELAEYERKQDPSRKNEGQGGGRRILNEERVAEMIEEALTKHRLYDPHNPITIQPTPYEPYRSPYRPFWDWGTICESSNKLEYEIWYDGNTCKSIC